MKIGHHARSHTKKKTNEIDPEPEKVHSIDESLLSLLNLQAHLMLLGEDTKAFNSRKKLEIIFIKKTHGRISIQRNKYYQIFSCTSTNTFRYVIFMKLELTPPLWTD